MTVLPVKTVFAVRMKKAWVLSYPLSTLRRLIRLVGWFCLVVAHMCYSEAPRSKLTHIYQPCLVWSILKVGICSVWSASLLGIQWVAKDSTFLHADREETDRTGWMPMLIWVFAGCTGHFVGFVVLWFKNDLPVFQPIRILLWFLSNITFRMPTSVYWWNWHVIQLNPFRSHQVHHCLAKYNTVTERTSNLSIQMTKKARFLAKQSVLFLLLFCVG